MLSAILEKYNQQHRQHSKITGVVVQKMLENIRMIDPCKSIQFWQFDGTGRELINGSVIVEAPVSLTVNGKIWMSFMCTPTHLEALAVGFLFNESIIHSITEVTNLRICENNENVDIWLTKSPKEPESWKRTSGCTGGITAAGGFKRPDFVATSDELEIPVSRVNILVEQLYQSQELRREAGGVHTSILSDGDQVIFFAEDIGQQNTVDKIAGLCLTENTWPSKRILVTTGRISSEMLQKAARVGVKVLISRTSPSSISVELAEAWGITLIGYARTDRFQLYTCPDRIVKS
jgi:FdhD protein